MAEKTLPIPEPPKKEAPKPSQAPAPAKNPIPAFLRDKKLAKEDQKLLRKLMVSQIHTTVTLNRRAVDRLKEAFNLLRTLNAMDTQLSESGLLTPEDRAVLDQNRAVLTKAYEGLSGIGTVVSRVSKLRLRELIAMEDALDREEKRQEHEEQKKKAAALREKQKQAAEQKLEGEERGEPTINLDPTLIAQATRGLTEALDPNHTKRDTGRSR